ncbi:MAG: PLP-dependent transferase [Kineosporiaceae bacterium]
MSDQTDLSPATVAVTAGRPPRTPDQPVNPSVELSSTYQASPMSGDGDRVYARWGNATWPAFEEVLGRLEGGQALLFSSGMAAIAATLSLVPAGGRVVAPRHAYSGTLGLLGDLAAAGRLEVEQVDVADTDAVLDAVRGTQGQAPAALLWVETPTNPMLEVADLPALVAGARAAGALVAADNTFATPLGLRPLEHGVDVVVHSVTKYLSGHSDVVLGATVAADAAVHARLARYRTMHGAIAGPFEAWLALRGLRTLALRVERAGANAAELARRLSEHPAVARVRHPSLPEDPGHARAAAQMRGFGAIVAIEVAGGADAAERLCAATQVWAHATSLGGVESSLERRRRQPAESRTVPESLVRLSVGIEDVEDLWRDLEQALAASSGPGA